jgi:hypothetical protein
MKWTIAGEDKAARGFLGIAFHTFVGTVGSPLLAVLLQVAIGRGHRVSDAVSIVSLLISGALLGLFFTPLLLSRSAPFVSLLGLAALWIGAHELWHAWSPTWSHQTQKDYLLSQLFCLGSGCSDSEGMYALFFGWPFLCLTSYSLGSLVALLAVRSKRANITQ